MVAMFNVQQANSHTPMLQNCPFILLRERSFRVRKIILLKIGCRFIIVFNLHIQIAA